MTYYGSMGRTFSPRKFQRVSFHGIAPLIPDSLDSRRCLTMSPCFGGLHSNCAGTPLITGPRIFRPPTAEQTRSPCPCAARGRAAHHRITTTLAWERNVFKTNDADTAGASRLPFQCMPTRSAQSLTTGIRSAGNHAALFGLTPFSKSTCLPQQADS